jgi:ABC-type Fe3+/spermidine/putrescine transport system ATPase subunit
MLPLTKKKQMEKKPKKKQTKMLPLTKQKQMEKKPKQKQKQKQKQREAAAMADPRSRLFSSVHFV